MSEIRVNNIKNEAGTGAPTFPNGVTVLGTLTGTATTATYAGTAGIATYSGTAGISTVAQNLTGNPSISVSGVNNTGISTLTDLRLASVADKITVFNNNSPTLAYNTGGGNVAVVSGATGPITLTVTGIPTTSDFDNRSINFAVIVRQGATGYGCSSLVLNGVTFNSTAAVGVSTRISYPSGTVATASTSCYDVFNFIGINTTGSASTMTNYNFISIKNGDFRFY
jgi:hypothetical protein